MKEEVVKILKKAFKKLNVDIDEKTLDKYLEVPKNSLMGNLALPCFFLVEKLKMEPHEIAVEIRKEIGNSPKGFEDIQSRGPYVNFFVDKKMFSFEVLSRISKEKDNFGKIITSQKEEKTILVEFPSPNTNKPLHLGHLRNMAIGESISRIAEFNGLKVIRANLNNDRGIHICQSMAAYQKYGKRKTPQKTKKKSDHFVGDYYVLFNERSKKNKELEILSHRMLQEYEEGDKDILKLWKKMNKWALDGFKETYDKFGIKHDKEYFESKLYQKGKEIILNGLKEGIFKQKKDKSVYINLGKKIGRAHV